MGQNKNKYYQQLTDLGFHVSIDGCMDVRILNKIYCI